MKKVAGCLLAVASLFVWEADVHACGGCFNRPETPTVVTDHHMIFSISAQQSTLYDQITYTGAPESFGWVLPFSGEIEVGVSSDVLFRTIDNATQTQVLPPPQNCPARPANCPVPDFASAGNAAPTGVNVLKREVVGPYDTAQLQASDPAALDKWLTTNGFSLPDAVKPVVAAYIAEKFNFLALKLVPGQGVQSMKPVRVTTKGANVALPLRMVAAGTGATVGVTLWVVAEGRYQPSNFDMFTITSDEIAWDWTQQKSNYIDLRTQKNAAAQGRAWELESVSQMDRNVILQTVNQGGPFTGFGGGIPYNPPTANVDAGADASAPASNTAGYTADGQKTADDVRDADFATLFANIPAGAEKITRIRADLDHAALDRDLTLQASTDQSLLNRVRQVTKELNEPLCPIYDGCDSTSSAPRSQAIAQTNDNNDDGCATTSTKRPSMAWMAVGLGVIGYVLSRRKKRA